MMAEHKEIFLQPTCPQCDKDTGADRDWCQDDVWTGPCENCGEPVKAVRYVLAEG